jgi:hypothetical protein
MATSWNYELSNFIYTPSSDDKVIKIRDKNNKLKYSIDPYFSYFYYKNNLVIIKNENYEDITLDFQNETIATSALEKLNTAKKFIINNNNMNVDYYTKNELNNGQLDNRYYNNTAATNIFANINHEHYITGLTDVTVNNILNKEVLVYDNGVWVNSSFTFDISIIENNYYDKYQLSGSNSGTVHINWDNIYNTPDTIEGYGINNVYNKSEVYNTAQTYTKIESDSRYYTKILSDTRYYQKSEINNILNGYSITSHTHNLSNLNDVLSGYTDGQFLQYSSGTWKGSNIETVISNNYFTSAQTINYMNNNYSLTSHTHNLSSLTNTAHTHSWIDIVNTAHTHDERYYTITQLNAGQLDNRYYTENEVNILISGHTHSWSNITNTSHTHDERYYTISQLNAGQLDSLYYSQTYMNSNFVRNSILLAYYTSAQTLVLFNGYYTSAQTNNILNGYSVTSHTHNLSGLTDVLINNTVVGNVLVFNGIKWVNSGLSFDVSNFYTKSQLDGGQLDNRYFTETEINNILTGYSTTSHTHNFNTLTNTAHTHLWNNIVNTAHTHDERYYTITQLNAGQLDSLYYSQTYMNSNFVRNSILAAYYTSSQTLVLFNGYYTSSQTNIILNEYSLSSHTHHLTGLTDVLVNNLLSGQVLVFNGTKWVNSGLSFDVSNFYTKAQLDGGQLDNRYFTSAQTNNILNDYSVTSHTHNFNSLTNTAHTHLWGNIVNTAHTHDERYYTITQLNAGQLDSLYYSQTYMNSNFVRNSILAAYYTSAQTLILLNGYYTSAQTNNILNGYSVTSHTHNLSGLTDILINNLSTGQTIIFNGIKWVNSGLSFDVSNFYTKTQLDSGQLDNRYFTETEINNILTGYSITSHTHNFNTLTNTAHTHLWNNIVNTAHTHDERYYTITQLNAGQLDTIYYNQNYINSNFVRNSVLAGYYTSAQTLVLFNGYYTSAQTNNILNGYSLTSHTHNFSSLTNTAHTHSWSNIVNTSHTHDERYYTSVQTNIILDGYSLSSHTHNFNILTNTAHTHLWNSIVNTSHTHDERYYTITQLNAGQLDTIYYKQTYMNSNFVRNSILAAYYTSAQTLILLNSYYTSSQTNIILNEYSLSSHTHNFNNVTGLTDVLVNNLTNGDILVYESGVWINSAMTINLSNYYTKSEVDNLVSGLTNMTSITYLHELLDVSTSITYALNNEALVWNSSLNKWINSSVTVDLSNYYIKSYIDTKYYTSAQTNLYYSNTAHTHNLSGLTDVASGATDGQFLQFSAGTWRGITSPILDGQFLPLSGGTLTGSIKFVYMSGVTGTSEKILYIDSGGTVKEGEEIILLYLTGSSLISDITNENNWTGNTYINSLSSYTLYDGQRYIDNNYFYEYLDGTLYRTYYSSKDHEHNNLYYTQTQLLIDGVLDSRYIVASGVNYLADMGDVQITLSALTNNSYLKYNTLTATWQQNDIDFSIYALNNNTVSTGTTIYGISGLTGGGTLNNNLFISHLTASTSQVPQSPDGYAINALTFDNYGHVLTYTLTDLNNYFPRFLYLMSDVNIAGLSDKQVLSYNSTSSMWKNTILTKSLISDFTESNYVHTTGTESISGIKSFNNDVIMNSNLTVNGQLTIINTEHLKVKDKIITLNSGQTTGFGVQGGIAGFEIIRGWYPDFLIVYDEGDTVYSSGGTLKIGISGNTQPVATRENNPISGGIAYWNNDRFRFDTNANLLYSGNTLISNNINVGSLTATTIYGTVSNLYLNDINDVDTSDVQQGYFLMYSAGTWVARYNSVDLSNYYTTAQTQSILSNYYTIGQTDNLLLGYSLINHTHTLSGLTDIQLSSLSNNDYLVYNGSKWINSAVTINLNNYYTKLQVYNTSETYNKTEIDNLIYKKQVVVNGSNYIVDYFNASASTGAEYIYTISSGLTNVKSGRFILAWDSLNSLIDYSHVTTSDLGNTSGLTLDFDINSGNIRFLTNSTSEWNLKLIRFII